MEIAPKSMFTPSKSLPGDIQGDYIAIVQTDLVDTRNSTTALLQNTTCTLSHKPRNCTSNITNVVSNLHSLTCKMRNLELPHTNRLVESVLGSVRCSCPAKPTQDPQQNRTRRTRRRQRELF
ncbi:hypothetical protein Q5P01_003962 [Channa striata]|uniref:Uncharacterized protein n=1 Tax=Channa striata TaxID=64152 RepID=A0AA88NIH5_CHASR|nr:hypothetical protein Q5P01_003962 [Channa striata]